MSVLWGAMMAIGFAVLVITGLALNETGRPYRIWLVAAHLVLALGAVTLLWVVFARESGRGAGTLTGVILTTVVLAGMIGTGGTVALLKEPPPWLLRMHSLGSWAALGLTAVALGML